MSKEAKKFEMLKTDAVIEVPKEIAVCPICGGKLTVGCDGWIELDDGWAADSLSIDCETEPDIDGNDWDDWFRGHYSMPYIDWLPVEYHILRWLNENYRWDLE